MPSSACQKCALDRKSTRLNSSHTIISYAVFCLKNKRSRPRNDTRPPRPPGPRPRAARDGAAWGGVLGGARGPRGPVVGALLGGFFFNDTATTEIYTLSLHDALPI